MSTEETQLAVRQPKASALAVMATRFNVEPAKLLETLKNTVFSTARSESQLMALVIVANEYGLNPFTKQIYAFADKNGGGIVPVVSVDGWTHLINSHPQMDGIEFEDHHDESGKLVSITSIIYRKDRSRPVKVTEYLSECRRNTEPWKMEHRMLRHKALIQGGRVAFGLSGVYDEDEAEDIKTVRGVVVETVQPPAPRKRKEISNDSGGGESRPAKPVGCPPDTDQPSEGTVLTVSGGAGAGSHEQEDPSRSSARPAVITTIEQVLVKCAEDGLPLARLLEYLREMGARGPSEELTGKLAQQVLTEWDTIVAQIRQQDGEASQEPAPEPLKADKPSLRAAIEAAGLDEQAVAQYLASLKKAGSGCKSLDMCPASALKFLAENFEQVREALVK